MKTVLSILLFISVGLFLSAQTGDELPHHTWALTPPMGWNSWDCFGPSVTEPEVKANADYMAANLLVYGWEYVVVDIRWYVDNQTTGTYNSFENSTFIYDEYGRYLPSPTRFPSSAGGNGFKPLADYVHGLGLKFGIHIMRGVPKVAVTNGLPIKGYESKTASDIYTTADECTWLHDNFTVLANREGAQEYYNSIFELYASWGVDFVKVDDLSRPYHQDEIELIRNAIDQCGRPMVLSMSPGATPLDKHDHARQNANMWRTVDDFWDNWSQLNYQFGVCEQWAPFITPGAWPDADMLPLGHIAIRGERGIDRQTNFTEAEQYTLMTLWTIFRSPLMFGGHLPDNDLFTNSLITNEEVLNMHVISVNNRQWTNQDDVITWTADDPTNGDMFVALFNNGGDGFVSSKDLLYRSGTVSTLTDGYGVNIDIAIPEGSTELYLLVGDGGDGFSCDHADWISPKIYLDNGDSILLTDLSWEYASAGWNSVQKNKSVSGGTLNIKGTAYTNGLGTHPRSVILYAIPDNTVRFKCFAGLDIGGTSQGCGSTVEFMVSVKDPTVRDVNAGNAIANSGRISRNMNREGVLLSADITGAEKLYLVVTDAGDNFNYDHGDWINPSIYKDNGDSILLTSINWVSATSGWSTIKKNTSLDGNPLRVNGITYSNGFGVNSYSIIEFDLPEGYTLFKSFCGFDDEVLYAPDGVSIEFMVFTGDPSVTDSVQIPVNLTELGFTGPCVIRNMWEQMDEGTFSGTDFAPNIPAHGSGLYRISATGRSSETELSLASSASKITIGDTIKLEVNLTTTTDGLEIPTGRIQIYQNDSLLISVEIDSSGNLKHATVPINPGIFAFTANYGGDVFFAPRATAEIFVEVTEPQTGLEENDLPSKAWITFSEGKNFLKGITPGDIVDIYTINGTYQSTFKAGSDSEVIPGKGMRIIKVRNANYSYVIKGMLF